MNKTHLTLAGIVTIVLVIIMIGYKIFEDDSIKSLTAAANVKETMNIGVDNWAGYTVLCSTKMRQIALDKQLLVKCHDDKADYNVRMENLKNGKLQAAAVTVDGYYLTGNTVNYPGQIVSVIDESHGGDAIYVNKSIATDTNDLKTKSGVRIAYTPNTPSETLLTAWALDFDVDINDNSRFILIKVQGATEARKLLENNKADVAVVWEPESAILSTNPNMIKIIGSNDVKNLIVDGLVVNDHFLLSKSEWVEVFLESYFETLEYFIAHQDEFDEAIHDYTGAKDDVIAAIKSGINWVDLPHNGIDWFGLDTGNINGRQQMYDTIMSAVRLYNRSGAVPTNTLPGQDPLRIINNRVISNVFFKGVNGQLAFPFLMPTQVVDYSITRPFKKLAPGSWAKLRIVGSFKIEDIKFSSGGFELDPPEQDAFKDLVKTLQTYPNYRIRVVGHTGQRGDDEANMILSKKRALAAKDYLVDKFGIDTNRIYAYGVGNQEPPALLPGQERDRAYYRGWPRVEIRLVEGG